MTFLEIKQRVLDHCNLSSPDAQTRVGMSINAHYRRITSMLGMDATRFVKRTQATTVSQAAVTFTAIEKIDRIREVSSGQILTEVTIHDQRTTPTGSHPPQTWALQNTGPDRVTVLLDSASPFVWTLEADGWTTLTDLAASDKPVFPESFHDILVWAVIAEELLKKEKNELSARYELKAERLLNNLQCYLADTHTRDTQQANAGGGNGQGQGTGGGIAPGVPVHAPNHAAGGGDPVNLLNLAGYPGGITTFLRADHTFAAPVMGAHAPTHEPGGSDPMAVDAVPAVGSLRTLGAGANQAAPGNDARFTAPSVPTAHAPTHLNAGSDPIVVTGLAGYPGNATLFLRGDGIFAAPPGGTIPGAHATTHEVGGGDVVVVTALGGYPGGVTTFLRADGTFAIPGGGVPAAHAPTHLSGGSDPLTVTGLAGFPGGITTFLRADGTFASPPATPVGGLDTQIQFNDGGVLAGHPGLTYDKTAGALTVGGEIVCATDTVIRRSTADGADSGTIIVAGGGSVATVGRGARLVIQGNEAGGAASIYLGNAAGAAFHVFSDSGTNWLTINGNDGAATFTASAGAWIFNSTAANGTYLQVWRSSTPIWLFGTQMAATGSGSITDACIATTGDLYIWAQGNNVSPHQSGNTSLGDSLHLWEFVWVSGGYKMPTWPTTAAAANGVVTDGGNLTRSTSSARYKTAITPLTDWRWFLDLEPVEFAGREAPTGRKYGGFTAEDVAAKSPQRNGLPVFAGLNNAGEPDDVAYAHLTAVIQLALKDIDRRLAVLET